MIASCQPRSLASILLGLFVSAGLVQAADIEPVRVADDRQSFVLSRSGKAFVPWGFNYDHDEHGRLIEDYWETEWSKVEADFREMRDLGANVVRVHLQVARFMDSADRPNSAALKRLGRLVKLAETLGLYLDLTGLGCYHKQQTPAWYDKLGEQERWEVQARFWEAVAAQCAESPAIFCYDLMNEPVVAGGPREAGQWLGPEFGGECFVQFISLDPRDRTRSDVARAWIHTLTQAIRKHDPRALITVGMVDWSLDRPGLTSGFDPQKVAGELDFVSVHVYPERGKVAAALKTLAGFAVGKPVLVEETFPLRCSQNEFEQFLDKSAATASGWIGFYWGETPQEYRRSTEIAAAIMVNWLEFFQQRGQRERPVEAPSSATK